MGICSPLYTRIPKAPLGPRVVSNEEPHEYCADELNMSVQRDFHLETMGPQHHFQTLATSCQLPDDVSDYFPSQYEATNSYISLRWISGQLGDTTCYINGWHMWGQS